MHHWKGLEGRVFHIESELSTEQIEKIKKLDCIESIEHKYQGFPTGVVSYFRLVLKNKIDFFAALPDELIKLTGRHSAIIMQCHPASLLGYTDTLTDRIFAARKLTSEEIKLIEGAHEVLYVQDLSSDDHAYYSIGITTDESGAQIVENMLKEKIRDLHLRRPEPAYLLASSPA